MSQWRLTKEELDYIFNNHYTIRVMWISPVERYDYRIFFAGKDDLLAVTKTPRAAYNFIRREVEKQEKK